MMEILDKSGEEFRFDELATSEKSQEKLTGFIDLLRDEVEGEEKWNECCKKADEELKTKPITEEVLINLVDFFEKFQRRKTPGHDKGHEYRDALTAIYNYSNIKDKVAYNADALAGLIGGIFHDVGVVIIPRGSDKDCGAGHGEAGAYFLDQECKKQNFLGENMRKLVAYAIAAHTNYKEAFEVKQPKGYIKKPYWNEITEKEGKLYGVAMAMTRQSDRMDLYSVAQTVRNVVSQTYSELAGINGSYLTSENTWVKCDDETLKNICSPIENSGDKKKPTTLQQCLGFVNGIDNPIYCNNDKYFPGFSEMIHYRAKQVEELNQVMNGENQSMNLLETDKLDEVFKEAKETFYKISKSNEKKFDLAWNGFKEQWNEMSNDYKNKWVRGFVFIEKTYEKILDDYQKKLEGTDFPILSNRIINELRVV